MVGDVRRIQSQMGSDIYLRNALSCATFDLQAANWGPGCMQILYGQQIYFLRLREAVAEQY